MNYDNRNFFQENVLGVKSATLSRFEQVTNRIEISSSVALLIQLRKIRSRFVQ